MPPTEVPCPRHPETVTALRCSRCEAPICPRCSIQTPVGARCRECARVVRSPVYTLGASHIARAFGAAIVGGAVMGLVWAFVLLPFTFGFLAIFIGAGLGWAFTRLVDLATGRKRGPITIAAASLGIVLAWGVLLLFIEPRVALYGLVAVGIGIYLAYANLR
ncbi:hypothetical protein HRbin29_00457 [bacterium HR29]|nr:hypothetical protein HRbin29_00457 [bacterium HR29]